MSDFEQPQGKDSVTTAQLAYVIGIERKRIENDIQRGLLPVEAGEGTGKARQWPLSQAIRINFFYLLRDRFGLDGKVAADHAANPAIEWCAADSTAGQRALWAIYKSRGESCAEKVNLFELLSNEWGFVVHPKHPGSDAQYTAMMTGIILIDVSAIEKQVSARWEAWWKHANSRHSWDYLDFFKEISQLNEGFDS